MSFTHRVPVDLREHRVAHSCDLYVDYMYTRPRSVRADRQRGKGDGREAPWKREERAVDEDL